MATARALGAAFAALLLLVAYSQPVSAALEMVEVIVQCTNSNNGIETNTYILPAPGCQPGPDGVSISGSCSAGFKFFNNTDCQGESIKDMAVDECLSQTPFGGSAARLKCRTLEDPEFIRLRAFPRIGPSSFDCSSDKFLTAYQRFDQCSTGGFFPIRLQKKNDTSYFQSFYNDDECAPDQVNVTATAFLSRCESSSGIQTDFVRASALGNNGNQVQFSSGISMFAFAVTIAVTMFV